MAKVIYSEIDNNPLFSGLAEVLPDTRRLYTQRGQDSTLFCLNGWRQADRWR